MSKNCLTHVILLSRLNSLMNMVNGGWKMRFVTFEKANEQRIGVLLADNQVLDLHQAQEKMENQVTLPDTLISFIELGESAVNKTQEILDWVTKGNEQSAIFEIGKDVNLLAPIPRPTKNIFCIGKNYAAHAKEMGAEELPKYPMVFSKAPTTVTGPFASVYSHKQITDSLDYEGELALIIGKKGTRISKEEAFDYVFGYTIINDITARNLQNNHKQFLLGKSLDTGCPMGPAIVHASLVANPHHLQVKTTVNGELRQNGNTEEFIFDIPTMIASISQGLTLEPGDIIATGTPSGVGSGFNPPKFLKAGDVVEIEIEGIGAIKNTIVE